MSSKIPDTPSSSGTRSTSVSENEEKERTQTGHLSSDTTEVSFHNSDKMTRKDNLAKPQEKTPMRYATRGKLLTEQNKRVEAEKEKIFSMSMEQKRKLYKCTKNYVELKDLPVWPDYYSESLASDPAMEKWRMRNKKNLEFPVNGDLNKKISIFHGDITTLEIDAIVNAANESLLGGGGVDGAIHRAAGVNLFNECELLNGCRPGEAKITCGYLLPAKHVIHTVGPRGERPEVLESCYKNSLVLMKENELKSVAFPCISTGIFGYPNLNAAKVALKTIRDWLDTEQYAKKIERIIFCLFLQKDENIYHEQLQLFFPLEKQSSKLDVDEVPI